MIFNLTINLNNEDIEAFELSWMLRNVAEKIRDFHPQEDGIGFIVRDINGNAVGSAMFHADKDEKG